MNKMEDNRRFEISKMLLELGNNMYLEGFYNDNEHISKASEIITYISGLLLENNSEDIKILSDYCDLIAHKKILEKLGILGIIGKMNKSELEDLTKIIKSKYDED